MWRVYQSAGSESRSGLRFFPRGAAGTSRESNKERTKELQSLAALSQPTTSTQHTHIFFISITHYCSHRYHRAPLLHTHTTTPIRVCDLLDCTGLQPYLSISLSYSYQFLLACTVHTDAYNRLCSCVCHTRWRRRSPLLTPSSSTHTHTYATCKHILLYEIVDILTILLHSIYLSLYLSRLCIAPSVSVLIELRRSSSLSHEPIDCNGRLLQLGRCRRLL